MVWEAVKFWRLVLSHTRRPQLVRNIKSVVPSGQALVAGHERTRKAGIGEASPCQDVSLLIEPSRGEPVESRVARTPTGPYGTIGVFKPHALLYTPQEFP
jgi:hypothetical protein